MADEDVDTNFNEHIYEAAAKYGNDHFNDESNDFTFAAEAEQAAAQYKLADSLIFLDLLKDYQKQAFVQTSRLSILDRAVSISRILTSKTAEQPRSIFVTNELCFLLYKRHTIQPRLEFLEEAIPLLQTVLNSPYSSSAPLDPPWLMEQLLQHQYMATGSSKHLDEFIAYLKTRVTESANDKTTAILLNTSLAQYLGRRYEKERKGNDLFEAFAIIEKFNLDSPPEDFSQRYMCYDTVGSLFRIRGEERHRSAYDRENDLRKAVEFGNLTLAQKNVPPQLKYGYQSHLNARKIALSKFTKDPEQLDTAVEIAEQAVKDMPTTLETYKVAKLFCDLEYALWNRFLKNQKLSDLDGAIKYAWKALDIAPPERPEYWAFVTDIGTLLGLKYEQFSPKDDSLLDQAVNVFTDHPTRIAETDIHFFDYVRGLSNRLWRRYIDRNNTDDLRSALSLVQKVDKVLQPEIHDLTIHYNNFSNLIGTRYELYGERADLMDAVKYGQKAVESITDSDSEAGDIFNTLARWLSVSYRDTRALEYLERAMKASEASIVGSPVNSPRRLLNLNTLCRSYMTFARRTRDKNILSKAIELAYQIVSESSDGHPQKPMFLSNLSAALLLRDSPAQTTASTHKGYSDLEQAYKFDREACEKLPKRHSERHIYLYDAARLMVAMYDRGKGPMWLKSAIKWGQKALDQCPEHHPQKALIQGSLADWLELSPLADPREIVKNYLAAFSSTSSSPLARILAAWGGGQFLGRCGKWAEANKMLSQAVFELLPLISPRWLHRDDQQDALKELSNLSALAATAELNAHGTIEQALIVMEAGHGLMAGLVMDSRNDLTTLAKIDSQKANEYKQLQDRIEKSVLRPRERFTAEATPIKLAEQPNRTSDVDKIAEVQIEDIRQDVERLGELDKEIRTVPGFEGFRKGLDKDEMIQLAKNGAIVYFNVTEFRSDAFIISDSIDLIELPKLQEKDLKQQVSQLVGPSKLVRRNSESRKVRNDSLREILAWLWDVAVVDVLKRLNYISPEVKRVPQDLPRIWWVASGLMGLTPLHAAGKYEADGSSTACTSMYAVSSYTPTLKALKYVQGRKLRRFTDPSEKILLVSMPETVGEAPLGSEIECREVRESISLRKVKTLTLPDKGKVLKELPTTTVVHFACHGKADSTDPSSGALLLCHKDPKRNDPLTIRELAAVRHDQAQIAYLSACSTAENPVENLMDEVIHLASTFQLIGFPHVIGTLWEAADDTAREVSRLFYLLLMKQMRKKNFDGNPRLVADALHEAIERTKVSEGFNFLAWVPFIHLGA